MVEKKSKNMFVIRVEEKIKEIYFVSILNLKRNEKKY